VAAPAKKAPSNDLGINFAELTSDTGSTTVKTAAKSAPSVAADSEITTQKVAIEKVKKKSAKASQAKKASTVTKKDSVKVASQKNALKKKATANQEKQKKLQKQAAGRRDEINREANRRDLARKTATKKILASRAKAKKAAITKQAKFNPNSLKKKKESGVNPAAFIFAAIGGAVGLTLLSGNDNSNSSKSKDATGSATANGAAEGANVTEAKNWVQRWRSRGTNKKEASSSPSAPGLPPIDPTADTKAAAAEEKEVAPSDTPTIE
jgi:vacuolar-type H+-ATPase subunit I/STV1